MANEPSMSPQPRGADEGRAEAVRVADRLHSLSIRLLRRLRREDGADGLSAPQLSALSVIVFAGPLPVGELAEAEQVRPPTISRLLRRLEREGLVSRESDPADGRVVRVRATAAGQRLLEAGRARRVAALAARFAALDPAELATLRDAAAVLERALGPAVPPGGTQR